MLEVSDHTPAFEGGPFLMLSERSSVDIHALHRQGFTISEIARRTGHDRKTIRAHLNGERQPAYTHGMAAMRHYSNIHATQTKPDAV